jgi:hypothetical protein
MKFTIEYLNQKGGETQEEKKTRIKKNKENYIFIKCNDEECEKLENINNDDSVIEITFKKTDDSKSKWKVEYEGNLNKEHIYNLLQIIVKIKNRIKNNKEIKLEKLEVLLDYLFYL